MKNNKTVKTKEIKNLRQPYKQHGVVVLSFVLILMAISFIFIATASKSTILETKMISNYKDKQRSLIAAESVALHAWKQSQTDFDIEKIINNGKHSAYYVLGDKIQASDKTANDWEAIDQVPNWPWDKKSLRSELPEHLGGDKNPMRLQSKPQYILGVHNAVTRRGTANYKCIPVRIIGASTGGASTTQSLVELVAIPKSGCYRGKVK